MGSRQGYAGDVPSDFSCNEGTRDLRDLNCNGCEWGINRRADLHERLNPSMTWNAGKVPGPGHPAVAIAHGAMVLLARPVIMEGFWQTILWNGLVQAVTGFQGIIERKPVSEVFAIKQVPMGV